MSIMKCLVGDHCRYNQIRGMAIRDYGGEIIETLEFRPDMSTSIE